MNRREKELHPAKETDRRSKIAGRRCVVKTEKGKAQRQDSDQGLLSILPMAILKHSWNKFTAVLHTFTAGTKDFERKSYEKLYNHHRIIRSIVV